MNGIKIRNTLMKDIEDYCKINNINNIENFINDLLSKYFMIEKYGERPFSEESKKNKANKNNKTEENIIKITKPKVKIIEK